MRKITFFGLLIVVLSGMDTPTCDLNSVNEYCEISTVDGFNFIRSNLIKIDQKNTSECSYVLTKDTSYKFKICNTDDNIKLIIFDSQRNAIATNQWDDQLVNDLVYECASTGIYYFQCSTLSGDTTNKCGLISFYFTPKK